MFGYYLSHQWVSDFTFGGAYGYIYGEGKLVDDGFYIRCTEEIPLANTRRIVRKEEFLGVVQNEWFKWFAQSNETFLNVQVGETEDDIVVGPNALCVYRELGKRFKDVC